MLQAPASLSAAHKEEKVDTNYVHLSTVYCFYLQRGRATANFSAD